MNRTDILYQQNHVLYVLQRTVVPRFAAGKT